MRQIRVSGFVRSDLPAEISMSHVGSNPMFQTFCQQSSATVTAKKGGKPTDGIAAWQPQRARESGPSFTVQRSSWCAARDGRKADVRCASHESLKHLHRGRWSDRR